MRTEQIVFIFHSMENNEIKKPPFGVKAANMAVYSINKSVPRVNHFAFFDLGECFYLDLLGTKID